MNNELDNLDNLDWSQWLNIYLLIQNDVSGSIKYLLSLQLVCVVFCFEIYKIRLILTSDDLNIIFISFGNKPNHF